MPESRRTILRGRSGTSSRREPIAWAARCGRSPPGSGAFAEPIRIALSNPFGVGNSHFRTGGDQPRWVDAVFGACWKREVFARIGGFDERLERSQDIEFSSRLRRAGGRILMSPKMQIDYYARATLGGFWKQNWSNGVWAILPFAHVSGIAVRWRHLAPLALVAGPGGFGGGRRLDRNLVARRECGGSLRGGEPGGIDPGGLEGAQHRAGVPDAAGVRQSAPGLWRGQRVGMRAAGGAADKKERLPDPMPEAGA